MSPVETPLDRVRATLLSHPGQIVPTQELMRVAFGSELPPRVLVQFNKIISDLIKDEEPIERTPFGFRIVLACESAGDWASSDLVAHLRERAGGMQGELFGGVA